MRAVLGIDAAWTMSQPSGVALAVETPAGWRLVTAVSSYQQFLSAADPARESASRPYGSRPNPRELLEAAVSLTGRHVDIVAIDMPLSRTPITGRRSADNLISRRYGAMKASTHTPSVERPGPLSDELRKAFGEAGYALLTSAGARKGLIEVYPHPALIELAGIAERFRYKEAKAARYWPGMAPALRRRELLAVWSSILMLLEKEIAGVELDLALPDPAAPRYVLKAFEDALDAVVCAWVGICALDGNAVPYGDGDAAIWVPLRDRVTDGQVLRQLAR